MFLISDEVEEAQKLAEEFMEKIKDGDYGSAKDYISKSIDLYELFDGENVISSYKMVGYGGDLDSIVRVEYLVEGLPAQTRNISFQFALTNDGWKIEQINVRFHIDRQDKKMVETYMQYLTEGNIWSAYELARDVPKDIQDKAYYQSRQYVGEEAWQLKYAKAVIVVEKYQNTKPRKSEFYYYTPDSTFELLIVAAHKIEERWIDNVVLKELE